MDGKRYLQYNRMYHNFITSLPKVIWEEGRVAALSHTYAVKSPLVKWRAQIRPQKYAFAWTDPQTALCASSLDLFDL